jgi:hypothetical protein
MIQMTTRAEVTSSHLNSFEKLEHFRKSEKSKMTAKNQKASNGHLFIKSDWNDNYQDNYKLFLDAIG